MFRILFIGTGDIAIPALRSLVARDDIELVGLVTGEDKPVGRKLAMTPPRIKTVAEEVGVAVYQPARIRDFAPTIAGLAPDLIVVMAYGQILPKPVLDAPRVACLNLHASLLPRHRGASPVQAAILEGEDETGITVMHVAEGLDTGDMVLHRRTRLAPDETGGTLHDKLAELAPDALGEALDQFASGGAPRTAQDPDKATYLGKLERGDGLIDWSRPAAELERSVRAFDPWPGTFTFLHRPGSDTPLRVKIFPPCSVGGEEPHGRGPGAVTAVGHDALAVATGDGTLVVRRIQPDGKRKMSVGEFLAGHPVEDGARFDA